MMTATTKSAALRLDSRLSSVEGGLSRGRPVGSPPLARRLAAPCSSNTSALLRLLVAGIGLQRSLVRASSDSLHHHRAAALEGTVDSTMPIIVSSSLIIFTVLLLTVAVLIYVTCKRRRRAQERVAVVLQQAVEQYHPAPLEDAGVERDGAVGHHYGEPTHLNTTAAVRPASPDAAQLQGISIENRVRPRDRLPRGRVVLSHENQDVVLDFRGVECVPMAGPPPLTREEKRRLEEAQNRISSPEYYGRAEYQRRQASSRSSPSKAVLSASLLQKVQLQQSFHFSSRASDGSSGSVAVRPGSPSGSARRALNGPAAVVSRRDLSSSGGAVPHDGYESTSDDFEDCSLYNASFCSRREQLRELWARNRFDNSALLDQIGPRVSGQSLFESRGAAQMTPGHPSPMQTSFNIGYASSSAARSPTSHGVAYLRSAPSSSSSVAATAAAAFAANMAASTPTATANIATTTTAAAAVASDAGGDFTRDSPLGLRHRPHSSATSANDLYPQQPHTSSTGSDRQQQQQMNQQPHQQFYLRSSDGDTVSPSLSGTAEMAAAPFAGIEPAAPSPPLPLLSSDALRPLNGMLSPGEPSKSFLDAPATDVGEQQHRKRD